MKQKDLVPKRRFKDFNDEWKKINFLEIVFRLSEKNKEEEIPRVEFEDINSGLGTLNKDIYRKKSNKMGIKFNSGDILFGKLRPYLKNWLLADFEGIAVGDFWVFRPNDIESELIYALIQGEKYQNIANLSTGTKMPRSDWEIVSNTKFALPVSNKEQEKIGQFFKHLDEMITLEQRKIDKIKALKSAYLAEMFPAEGERIPKRRFAGFTDEWEEQKLGDIAEVIGTGDSNFITKTKETTANPYAVLGSTSVIGYDSEYDYSGKFILTARVGANAGNIYKYSGQVKISDNTVFIKSNNLEFLFYLLEKYNLKNLSFGTGQPLIKASELNNLILKTPDKKEQQKIGSFFKKIDDTILNHQQKLAKLKATKQAYLHEMFV